MSLPAKGSRLRLVMPSDSSSKIISTLGPAAKVESKTTVLTAGRLTTDDIVGTIRELTRLRDEILHTMRQLGIAREARTSGLEKLDFEDLLTEAHKQLEGSKRKYQDIQSRIDTLERESEEAKKKAVRFSEVKEAGLASAEAFSAPGQFTKLLGRLPVRKLEPAKRTIRSTFQDQVVAITGSIKKDWVYILLAVPAERIPAAMQTLLLYDFVQTEIPPSEEPDLEKALKLQIERGEMLSKDIERAGEEKRRLWEETRETLNRLADSVQESLIYLKAVLSLGEGSEVAYAFAQIEKVLPAKTAEKLSRQGVLFETD